MAGLIVSVRDAAEALVAMQNGASLIDVKEPTRGALGKADDAVIQAVIAAVGGRLPVSAAWGEADEGSYPFGACRIEFAKYGTLDANDFDWREVFRVLQEVSACDVVPCVYADAPSPASPCLDEVCRFAVEHRFPAFLIDTHAKDGRTLLDHIPLADLARIAARCRDGGVKLALAGSLTAGAIRTLLPLGPDWFAVRGAACEGGREGRISGERVRALADLVRGA